MFSLIRKWGVGAAWFFLLGATLWAPVGCTSQPMVDLPPESVPPEKTVVLVNGEPLSAEEFDNEFRLMSIHYSAVTEDDMRTIKRRLFEQVIDRRLLVQEARKIGLKMTRKEAEDAIRDALKNVPEDFLTILKVQGVSEQAWKRKLLQERLARKLVDQEVNRKVEVTSSEVEDYYWSHLSDYWEPDAVRVRHLVVTKRTDLQKALDGLKKGEDFSRIASTFSVGPEKSSGGDWGYMSLDRLSTDYRKALADLKPGEVSRPLKDDFGYHLFQLLERRSRRMRSFNEVKNEIHDSLLKEEENQRFDQWMADLKKKANIRVNQEMAPVIGVTLEGLSGE